MFIVLLAPGSDSADGAMKRLGLFLAVLWGLLGLGLVIDGIVESLSWAGDPTLAGSNLRWWYSTLIIPGVVAALFALMLLRGTPIVRPLGYSVAAVFALYVVYIMLITPSPHFLRPMLVLQWLVLGLAVVTMIYLAKGSGTRTDQTHGNRAP